MRKHANAAKTKMILFVFAVFACISSLALVNSIEVRAQSLSDIFEQSTYPVNYEQPRQLGGSGAAPDSIDDCLKWKQYKFNEIYNIWVEGMVRCEYNRNGVLAATTYNDLEVPADETKELLCYNRSRGSIVENGSPSEENARHWSERCSYLGTVGGAGPILVKDTTGGEIGYPTGTIGGTYKPGVSAGTPNTGARLPTDVPESSGSLTPYEQGQFRNLLDDDHFDENELAVLDNFYGRMSVQEREAFQSTLAEENQSTLSWLMEDREDRVQSRQAAAATVPAPVKLVYDGPGITVPAQTTVPEGISKEQSLSKLIVYYTNATLPYVSVVSIFVFVAAGIFYIVSFTNEELNTKAKTMMIYVVIGIVIIFSAYTVINTLLRLSELGG